MPFFICVGTIYLEKLVLLSLCKMTVHFNHERIKNSVNHDVLFRFTFVPSNTANEAKKMVKDAAM